MLFKAGEVAFDGVADICKSFRAGCALRDAAGQIGALDDKRAVSILLDSNSKAKGHVRDYPATRATVKERLAQQQA